MDAFSLAFLAACVWGSSAFLEKMGVNGGDPMAGVLARSTGVVVGTLAYALAWPRAVQALPRMPFKSFLCFALGGILASVIGQIFFYQALKKGEIGRVAAVGGAWPAIAFILGLLFLGEPFSWRKTAGVTLVLFGVILLR
jgi:bacterial/archaeal transporter family protein